MYTEQILVVEIYDKRATADAGDKTCKWPNAS